jgi:hypothetical protein
MHSLKPELPPEPAGDSRYSIEATLFQACSLTYVPFEST